MSWLIRHLNIIQVKMFHHNYLFYCFTLLTVALLCVFPIQSFDLFSYLFYGKIMDLNQTLIQTDPSLIQPTLSKFDLQHQWLTYSVFYQLYKWGGYIGIVAFKLMLLLSFVMIYFLMSKKKYDLYPFIGFFSITTFVLGHFRLVERGSLFSDMFIIIISILIVSLLKNRRATLLHLLSVFFLMILWSNLHPGFVFGIGLLMIYTALVIGQAIIKKRESTSQYVYNSLFLLVTAIVATWIHPLGIKSSLYSISFVFEKFSLYQSTNKEWVVFYQFFQSQPIIVFTIVLLFFLCLVFFLIIRKDSPKKDHLNFILMLYCICFIGGLMSLRFMFTWIMLLPVLTMLMLAESARFTYWISHRISRNIFKLAILISFCFILYGKMQFISFDNKAFGIGIDDRLLPMKAILKSELDVQSKHIFNHISWGGVLSFYTYPDQKIFINGFCTEPEFLNLYFSIIQNPSNQLMNEIIQTFDLDTFILPSKKLPLVNWLLSSKEWDLVYQDNVAIIFEKKII